jgi:hypothetical protein
MAKRDGRDKPHFRKTKKENIFRSRTLESALNRLCEIRSFAHAIFAPGRPIAAAITDGICTTGKSAIPVPNSDGQISAACSASGDLCAEWIEEPRLIDVELKGCCRTHFRRPKFRSWKSGDHHLVPASNTSTTMAPFHTNARDAGADNHNMLQLVDESGAAKRPGTMTLGSERHGTITLLVLDNR